MTFNVPTEIVVVLLSAIGVIMSVAVHLLIRINSQIAKIRIDYLLLKRDFDQHEAESERRRGFSEFQPHHH